MALLYSKEQKFSSSCLRLLTERPNDPRCTLLEATPSFWRVRRANGSPAEAIPHPMSREVHQLSSSPSTLNTTDMLSFSGTQTLDSARKKQCYAPSVSSFVFKPKFL